MNERERVGRSGCPFCFMTIESDGTWQHETGCPALEITRLRKAYADLAPVAIELREERDRLRANVERLENQFRAYDTSEKFERELRQKAERERDEALAQVAVWSNAPEHDRIRGVCTNCCFRCHLEKSVPARARALLEMKGLISLMLTEALGNKDDEFASVPMAYLKEAQRLLARWIGEHNERTDE